MSQLGKRLMFSAVFVSIAVYAIFYLPIWGFVAVVELLVLLCLNEFYLLAEKKGLETNRWAGLAFGSLVPIVGVDYPAYIVLVFACLGIFVLNFRKRLLNQALISTSVTMFGLVYIAWFFSMLVDTRELPMGARWVFYIALIVKGGDAGAYFTGRKLGKRKLLEHVSPNKSVEGAIGGFLTTVGLSLISSTYLPGVGLGHLLVIGVLVGVISQIGDLAESLLKRDVGIKDSGVIPGLGGIFDMLDSLLLTIPFVHFYIIQLYTREAIEVVW